MSSIRKPTDGFGRSLVLLEFADAAQLEVARPRGVAGPVEVRHQREHVLEMLLPGILAALPRRAP